MLANPFGTMRRTTGMTSAILLRGPAIVGLVDIDIEQCLVRAAGGDQRAFAELYDATSSRVFGLVLRILVDRAQAEEVAQEVFLEAWRQAKRFDPTRGAAVSWLLQMAHARAVDRVRASQAQRDRDRRIGERDLGVPVDDVSERAEISLDAARARQALEELPDAQREAIELAYFGGYTQSEIAERLGTPLGTVKTRLRDGMIRLRGILGVTA